VLTVSRLEPSKRPFDFLKVAEVVSSKISDVEFVWVGDGTMRQRILTLLDQTNTKNVRFVGRLAEKDKELIMCSSDVYVSTSESEGFALTPGEAILKGLPVVVYDLPVYAEIYKDFLLKVKPFDTQEFASKVIVALEKPEWLIKKIEEAKLFIRKNYSYDSVGSRATEALKMILGITDGSDARSLF
jgi:glycosyltransferase involved in cell wall biosynthesis